MSEATTAAARPPLEPVRTAAVPASAVRIGAVRPEEAGAEAELIARAFAAGPYGHLNVGAERRAFERDTAGRAASGTVLVARDGADRVVGTASVLRAGTAYARVAEPGEAEIRLLAVDPEAQGARIGEALMRASLEVAAEWGADALVLDTGARNLRAQALYERLGFVHETARDAGVGSEVDSFVYRHPVQPRADVRVRLMHADETDDVSALAVGAYAASYELSDRYRADIGAVAERARDHQVWVATDAATGALLGTVSTPRAGRAMSAVAGDDELDFRLLAVAADARRRGIGELLVGHVLGLARLRGTARVVLNTSPDMVAAHRLYERLGFERLPEREYVFERPDGSSFLMMAYGRPAAASAR